ncbi:MAG: bifunctional riboflavin kinase/FAD synthetase [Chloroflexi bacterium]|nr:bifunctional riboflavin kinase/FAD synthetase [Chloroflexota bacterium]
MRLLHGLDGFAPDREVVLTIGTFDGVHLGHQHLLRELVSHAQQTERLSAALTFYPHPRAVLQPGARLTYLSTPEERAAIIESLGVGLLVLLPFSPQLAEMPAEDFVKLLYERLCMRELWVGEGFAMGRNREGNTAQLRAIAPQVGFTLRTVEPYLVGGEPVSSTRIRQLLAQGRVDQVAQLLGRDYAVSSYVIRGAQRGRTLGFRTANLSVSEERALPLDGVYAVRVTVDGQPYAGVANVGIRPTFDSGGRLLEVHLLDYEGDLYDCPIQVAFVQRLRAERRFDDGQALALQISRDIRAARIALGQVVVDG